MPSYKTHSIHGELVLPQIDKQIEINNEDLKLYCMGPDAMISTDYQTFEYQHSNKTKDFFITMLKLIKENKLHENSEVIAFLYGQLDHYVLDSIMHPLIYYMTEDIEVIHKIKPHGLVEMWIDDYVTQKYNKNEKLYYHKFLMKDKKLKKMIDDLYKKVYGVENESVKYNLGMFSTIAFDTLARRNLIGITPLITKMFNLGNVIYRKDINRVLPYLNLNNDKWCNPEIFEEYNDSFDDLWNNSTNISLEMIADVNKYLYQDRQLTNSLILNNTSFNTGLPCEKGQSLKYVKKYKIKY